MRLWAWECPFVLKVALALMGSTAAWWGGAEGCGLGGRRLVFLVTTVRSPRRPPSSPPQSTMLNANAKNTSPAETVS